MMFFAARGKHGEDIFDENLKTRNGMYDQYHHGDINSYHVSYFRRNNERHFNTCNLRKSYGLHMVCQGADPIPAVLDAKPPYHILLIKCKNEILFYINHLRIFKWTDDNKKYGCLLGQGKMGFRQMAPLIAEYANLRVRYVERRGTGQ